MDLLAGARDGGVFSAAQFGAYLPTTITAAAHTTATAGPRWIDVVSALARTGYIQTGLIIASLAGIVHAARGRRRRGVGRPLPKASRISVGFELCSQLARALALAFAVLAAVRGGGQWPTVALVGFLFVLGLSRLANDVQWRHVALHQVNFLQTGALAVLAAAELLPLLDIGAGDGADAMALGATAAIAAAVAVAVATPREWLPPQERRLPTALSHRMPALEPVHEEKASWLSYYWTYEWLTPMVWTGTRNQVTIDDLPACRGTTTRWSCSSARWGRASAVRAARC